MNPRLFAAQIIDQVTDGRSLTDCLRSSLVSIEDPRDRSFIQAICYGVCRYYTCLDTILSCLLENPMKAKDSDVHALLLVGLYQLAYMRVPPHAAVAETVNATKKLNKPWARGLVNAILREYLRNQNEIIAENQIDPEYKYAHPLWWISAIKKAWPDHWEAVLEANNAHPPFALRVNSQQIARDDYLKKLSQAQIIPETRSGLMLETPIPIENVEGFSKGMISVQDGAAQLAAELLDLAPHQRVLDACAAPGGKLTHILELEPELTACIAVEKETQRMVFIQENLTRSAFQAKCICADVNQVDRWWDGQLFDRILLDAPCSASGVIRRHPDIKLLREPTDIQTFAHIQLQLLQTLWPLLRPGGLLVYATCSIFPEENVAVLEKFFAAHPEAKEKPIEASWGLPCEIGRQILPGMHNMDGFYYARIEHCS
jgi:16S rRNA (cytosine967-C5)-methyltransferase